MASDPHACLHSRGPRLLPSALAPPYGKQGQEHEDINNTRQKKRSSMQARPKSSAIMLRVYQCVTFEGNAILHKAKGTGHLRGLLAEGRGTLQTAGALCRGANFGTCINETARKEISSTSCGSRAFKYWQVASLTSEPHPAIRVTCS